MQGTIYERRITELSLAEFLSYGPQKEGGLAGKPLMRKTKDGKIVSWIVETDDSACTLKEAFEKVNPSIGFNIELKFDDHIVYQQDYLIHVIKAVLHVVLEYAKGRPIIFSSFQPDAALLVKNLQTSYPVRFPLWNLSILNPLNKWFWLLALKSCRYFSSQMEVQRFTMMFEGTRWKRPLNCA